MANYHLLGRKVENCLLGLFDDPDRPRSPDHGEKISKSFVVFITYNYLNILISITPIQYTWLVIQCALQPCKNIFTKVCGTGSVVKSILKSTYLLTRKQYKGTTK